MIPRQIWTDHTFNLNIHPGWQHNIMSRILDTEVRLLHHARPFTDAQLSYQPNGEWSIKQHIGHLTALEEVHSIRLKEFEARLPGLTMADMSNKKTHSANYNEQSLEELINDFRKERADFVAQFNALSEGAHYHAAVHPRLKVNMKPVDLLYFVAEHDDHHIASIMAIKKQLTS